jgi:TetR/AcrR family transcriptional repressor of nem operon
METRPDRKALTHRRIVETASQAIRASGFQGVGVAEVMKRAGLTHGGFYAHFPSRDALLVEAVEHAGQESRARIGASASASRRRKDAGSAFREFVESYLSEQHLRGVETGCVVAALLSEVPRQAPEVRVSAVQRIRGLVAHIQNVLPGASHADATVIAGQLVGALQLARALGQGEGKPVLAAARSALLERYDFFPARGS